MGMHMCCPACGAAMLTKGLCRKCQHRAEVHRLKTRIAKLEAENDKLRAALKPFGALAKNVTPSGPGQLPNMYSMAVDAQALVNARDALAAPATETTPEEATP